MQHKVLSAIALTLTALVVATPSEVPALFLQANTSLETVLRARLAIATASDALAVPTDAAVLSVEVPTRLPPSGIVVAVVAWPPSLGAAAGDALTLHCSAHTSAADFGDILILTDAHVAEGRVTVPLVRSRCSYQLRYIRGAAALVAGTAAARDAEVIAASAPVVLGADTDASGTRVAFGQAAGDIQLSWFSGNATAPAYVRLSKVSGGPYGPPVYADAPPVTYTAADMCHAPATTSSIVSYVDPGYLHTVVLRLNASERYFAVYGQTGGIEAPETSFRTRKTPGPDVPTRFAAFGDSATYPVFPGTVTTFDLIDAMDAEGDDEKIDFVAVVGDLAYAEGCVHRCPARQKA